MNEVKIRVPATSANLGPGFDALGLAVSLYHTITLSEAEKTSVYVHRRLMPDGERNNLILKAARMVYDRTGASQPAGFSLIQESFIPSARGLGSSAACVAGGLLAANRLLGDPLSIEELLKMGVQLEGHPDNLVPAFFGGFCVSGMEKDRLLYARCEVKRKLRFVALVPDFRMRTSESRAALPESLDRQKIATQIAASSLVTSAFFSGRYELLAAAKWDHLCTPARLNLIPGGKELVRLAEENGALTAVISGAGSSVLAVFDSPSPEIDRLISAVKQADLPVPVRCLRLKADNRGARFL